MSEQFPVLYNYEGDGVMRASTPYQRAECKRRYEKGKRYALAESWARSHESHSHYFATLHDAWLNLPEAVADEFPTFEIFRSRGLIATGYFDERRCVCATEDAGRLAAFVAPLNALAVVAIANAGGGESVVIVRTAKSQSYKAMPKGEFQRSKQDVFEWAWALVGVNPETGEVTECTANNST